VDVGPDASTETEVSAKSVGWITVRELDAGVKSAAMFGLIFAKFIQLEP